MREKNELEILMQLKMEEFQMEPRPADWQAIYDQLHPKKKRRFFWWWFPLLAGLSLFGAFWLSGSNHSDRSALEKTSPVPSAQQDPNNRPSIEQRPTAEHYNTPKTGPGSSNSTAAHIGQSIVLPYVQKQNPSKSFIPHQVRESSKQADSKNEPIEAEVPPSETKTQALEKTDRQIPEIIAANTSEQNNVPALSTMEDSAKTTSSNQLEKKSIPNLSTHLEKGWYAGVYASLATNKPVEPVSMTKSADFASLPGSGSTTYRMDNGTSKKGVHYALGAAVERKMKGLSLQTGLGFQYNSWSSSTNVYQSFISSGNTTNTSFLGTITTEYELIAVEIPAILNIRLAGKKNSFWLGTGINNAFGLKLNSTSNPTSLSSFNNQAAAKATTYQPQFHLGLVYEHIQKKSHWQLSPFLQYGLNQAARSGSDDHLLQFGIKGRYFFKRLK